MKKTEWMDFELMHFPKADKTVLEFIANFRFKCGEGKSDEIIEHLFRAGYCWYFAHMLQQAFGRGKVCYAYDEGHFVWLDGKSESQDIAYDISGVNREWEHLIPEELLGDIILDFQHVPGKQSSMEDPEIIGLLLDIINGRKNCR